MIIQYFHTHKIVTENNRYFSDITCQCKDDMSIHRKVPTFRAGSRNSLQWMIPFSMTQCCLVQKNMQTFHTTQRMRELKYYVLFFLFRSHISGCIKTTETQPAVCRINYFIRRKCTKNVIFTSLNECENVLKCTYIICRYQTT